MSNKKSLPTTEAAVEYKAMDQIQDTPLFPLQYGELKKLGKLVFKSSLPASISFVSMSINGLVCLKFIGELGDATMLAGASLGITWGNAFCTGIILSINQGFAVLASQTFGAGQNRRLGILYQRNLFVLGIIAIPLILSLWFW